MVSVSAEQNSLRLKLTHPKLFTDVCYSHASRLLGIRDRRRIVDLIGDIQGTIVDPLASHTSAATTKKLFKAVGSKAPDHRILGSPLDDGIVDCIVPVIKFLHRSDCLKTEGLFRIPGNCRHLKTLCKALNCGEDVARLLAVGSFSAHDGASLLKAFLSELPEPLLSERHFSVHSLAAEQLAEQHLQLLQILIHFLPPANVLLLKHLLGLLRRVCDQRETRMTAASLGRIFAPHLLVPRRLLAGEMLSVIPVVEKVVSLMISRSAALFRLPDTVLRDMERQWAVAEQGAGSGRPARRVERRCAMKRTRADVSYKQYFSERGTVKSSVSVPLAAYAQSSQSPDVQSLLTAAISENSRVIIVDFLENSSPLHSGCVHPSDSVSLSTSCCPRTGHYSKSVGQYQNGLATAKSVFKYATVTSV